MKPESYFGYLNGLTQMASSVSVRCGPSVMRVDCFSPKSYAALFCKEYRLRSSLLQLHDSGCTLQEKLEAWLGDDPRRLVEGLCHLIHIRLGDALQVLEPENIGPLCDALSAPGGRGPFYTTEDLFFAVFRDVAVCFMMGNYE